MFCASLVTNIADKFESVLAVDVAMAVFHTFAESQALCAHNLVNLYLDDELQDATPDVITCCILSLVLTHERPFIHPPVYHAVLLNSIINASKEVENLKKMKVVAEEKIAKLFEQFDSLPKIQQDRFVIFLGTYLSQSSGKDLGMAESFLLKLTESPSKAVLK